MSETPMDLEKATESTLAKAINKIVLPALASIAVVVITWMVQDMRTAQQTQSDQIGDFKGQLQKVDGKVDLLNAKVDSGVLWRIGEIERRLNHVEQAQKTP
jgi:hypothetical protein